MLLSGVAASITGPAGRMVTRRPVAARSARGRKRYVERIRARVGVSCPVGISHDEVGSTIDGGRERAVVSVRTIIGVGGRVQMDVDIHADIVGYRYGEKSGLGDRHLVDEFRA